MRVGLSVLRVSSKSNLELNMKYNTIQYNTIQSKRLEGGGGLTNRLIKTFICEDESDGVKCDGKCYEGTPGADPGGGGSWGSGPPPPFGGPPNFIKRWENVVRMCMKRRVLYFCTVTRNPPPLSESLYPPLYTSTYANE